MATETKGKVFKSQLVMHGLQNPTTTAGGGGHKSPAGGGGDRREGSPAGVVQEVQPQQGKQQGATGKQQQLSPAGGTQEQHDQGKSPTLITVSGIHIARSQNIDIRESPKTTTPGSDSHPGRTSQTSPVRLKSVNVISRTSISTQNLSPSRTNTEEGRHDFIFPSGRPSTAPASAGGVGAISPQGASALGNLSHTHVEGGHANSSGTHKNIQSNRRNNTGDQDGLELQSDERLELPPGVRNLLSGALDAESDSGSDTDDHYSSTENLDASTGSHLDGLDTLELPLGIQMLISGDVKVAGRSRSPQGHVKVTGGSDYDASAEDDSSVLSEATLHEDDTLHNVATSQQEVTSQKEATPQSQKVQVEDTQHKENISWKHPMNIIEKQKAFDSRAKSGIGRDHSYAKDSLTPLHANDTSLESIQNTHGHNVLTLPDGIQQSISSDHREQKFIKSGEQDSNMEILKLSPREEFDSKQVGKKFKEIQKSFKSDSSDKSLNRPLVPKKPPRKLVREIQQLVAAGGKTSNLNSMDKLHSEKKVTFAQDNRESSDHSLSSIKHPGFITHPMMSQHPMMAQGLLNKVVMESPKIRRRGLPPVHMQGRSNMSPLQGEDRTGPGGSVHLQGRSNRSPLQADSTGPEGKKDNGITPGKEWEMPLVQKLLYNVVSDIRTDTQRKEKSQKSVPLEDPPLSPEQSNSPGDSGEIQSAERGNSLDRRGQIASGGAQSQVIKDRELNVSLLDAEASQASQKYHNDNIMVGKLEVSVSERDGSGSPQVSPQPSSGSRQVSPRPGSLTLSPKSQDVNKAGNQLRSDSQPEATRLSTSKSPTRDATGHCILPMKLAESSPELKRGHQPKAKKPSDLDLTQHGPSRHNVEAMKKQLVNSQGKISRTESIERLRSPDSPSKVAMLANAINTDPELLKNTKSPTKSPTKHSSGNKVLDFLTRAKVKISPKFKKDEKSETLPEFRTAKANLKKIEVKPASKSNDTTLKVAKDKLKKVDDDSEEIDSRDMKDEDFRKEVTEKLQKLATAKDSHSNPVPSRGEAHVERVRLKPVVVSKEKTAEVKQTLPHVALRPVENVPHKSPKSAESTLSPSFIFSRKKKIHLSSGDEPVSKPGDIVTNTGSLKSETPQSKSVVISRNTTALKHEPESKTELHRNSAHVSTRSLDIPSSNKVHSNQASDKISAKMEMSHRTHEREGLKLSGDPDQNSAQGNPGDNNDQFIGKHSVIELDAVTNNSSTMPSGKNQAEIKDISGKDEEKMTSLTPKPVPKAKPGSGERESSPGVKPGGNLGKHSAREGEISSGIQAGRKGEYSRNEMKSDQGISPEAMREHKAMERESSPKLQAGKMRDHAVVKDNKPQERRTQVDVIRHTFPKPVAKSKLERKKSADNIMDGRDVVDETDLQRGVPETPGQKSEPLVVQKSKHIETDRKPTSYKDDQSENVIMLSPEHFPKAKQSSSEATQKPTENQQSTKDSERLIITQSAHTKQNIIMLSPEHFPKAKPSQPDVKKSPGKSKENGRRHTVELADITDPSSDLKSQEEVKVKSGRSRSNRMKSLENGLQREEDAQSGPRQNVIFLSQQHFTKTKPSSEASGKKDGGKEGRRRNTVDMVDLPHVGESSTDPTKSHIESHSPRSSPQIQQRVMERKRSLESLAMNRRARSREDLHKDTVNIPRIGESSTDSIAKVETIVDLSPKPSPKTRPKVAKRQRSPGEGTVMQKVKTKVESVKNAAMHRIRTKDEPDRKSPQLERDSESPQTSDAGVDPFYIQPSFTKHDAFFQNSRPDRAHVTDGAQITDDSTCSPSLVSDQSEDVDSSEGLEDNLKAKSERIIKENASLADDINALEKAWTVIETRGLGSSCSSLQASLDNSLSNSTLSLSNSTLSLDSSLSMEPKTPDDVLRDRRRHGSPDETRDRRRRGSARKHKKSDSGNKMSMPSFIKYRERSASLDNFISARMEDNKGNLHTASSTKMIEFRIYDALKVGILIP